MIRINRIDYEIALQVIETLKAQEPTLFDFFAECRAYNTQHPDHEAERELFSTVTDWVIHNGVSNLIHKAAKSKGVDWYTDWRWCQVCVCDLVAGNKITIIGEEIEAGT